MRMNMKAFFTGMAVLVGLGLTGCDGATNPEDAIVSLEDAIVSRHFQERVLTPQCVEDRELAARDMSASCPDRGRADGACEQEAAEIIERPCDVPEPPDCDDICERRAQQVFAACRDGGGSLEECERAADIAKGGCVQRCEDPDPTCREICVARAFHTFKDCLRDGGNLLRCALEGRDALRRCLRLCEEPDPPVCEDICARRARAIFNECMDAGDRPGDVDVEERCGRLAREFFERCLRECEEPDPPTCGDICRLKARRIFHECVRESGVDLSTSGVDVEAKCGEIAREFLERCLRDCDPPPTCDDICRRKARGAYNECIDDGGSPEDCGEKAEEVRDRCLDACEPPGPCCDPAERPGVDGSPICIEGATCCANGEWACNQGDGTASCDALGRVCPYPCLETCLRDGRGVIDECLDAHDDLAFCADRVADHVDRCRVVCPIPIPPPPPCPWTCELDVVGQFEGCIDDGLSDEVCGTRALDGRHVCSTHCPDRL